ncbi:serine hydrolase domain-containing protein [Actinoplanes sp. NPDC024001]|uniref:serine hydrolase domain-containing protein n=1 Tax=Actinoplanes sp. NPDC024001 TaxID=3154598 RepID=UPI003403EB7F
MSDLEGLTRQAVAKLAPGRNGVVVAAIAGDTVEIQGSGGLGAATRFEIGSVSKVFTSLALARLTVAGVTSLDEPLRDLLPAGLDVPSRDGQEITLRHLATHTSGLSRLPTGMLLGAILRPTRPDPYAHCTEDYLLGALSRAKLGAVPGRRFRYSNFGAGLLGLALARRAGLGFDALISREIGTPLGLTGTGTGGPTTQGHRRNGRPEAPWHLADLAGAGGLRSTATDLVAFVRAHLAGDGELAPAIRLALETEHRVNPFLTARLGWMAQRLHAKQGGHLQIFHNGATGGFFSFTGFDPETGVGVVVLSDTQRSVDAPAFELLRGLQSGV